MEVCDFESLGQCHDVMRPFTEPENKRGGKNHSEEQNLIFISNKWVVQFEVEVLPADRVKRLNTNLTSSALICQCVPTQTYHIWIKSSGYNVPQMEEALCPVREGGYFCVLGRPDLHVFL